MIMDTKQQRPAGGYPGDTAGTEVNRWRMARLRDAGVDAVLAARLAVSRAIDLHALLELVERGCPPVLAARILSPLEGDEVSW